MRTRQAGVTAITVTAGTAVALLLSGCSGGDAQGGPVPSSTSDSAAPPAVEPRTQLSGLVAAAKDRHYAAGYTLRNPNKPNRAVAVTVADDGTWRVDIQGGALGGTADVAIAGRPDGQYQCALGRASGCVKVAAPGKKLPAAIDPKVHYPFALWLDVLIDRQVPLSVAPADRIADAPGTCFNVEPAVTAVEPPIDAGVFCYSDDGLLTAAKLSSGTLVIAGPAMGAPSTITLPGPVVNAAPLSTTAPPSPSAAPTSTSAAPTRPGASPTRSR